MGYRVYMSKSRLDPLHCLVEGTLWVELPVKEPLKRVIGQH